MTAAASARRSKRHAAATVLDGLPIRPGMRLGIGGFFHTCRPVALLRLALPRLAGGTGVSIYSTQLAGYDVDCLIALDVVAETFIPTVTFEALGLAPSFRLAAETGTVQAHLLDAITLVAGYQAAALGLPFFPVTAWTGSDVPVHNPLASRLPAPYDHVWAVAPIVPEVLLMHAPEGDEFGNVRLPPGLGLDASMARAAECVVVSVDRLISNEQIRQGPLHNVLPGMYVDRICEIPFGAHPTASPGKYPLDEPFLRTYWLAAEHRRRMGDDTELTGVLDRYWRSATDPDRYRTALTSDGRRG